MACHERLVNTKMEPGQDPDDLFSSWTNAVTSSKKRDRWYTTRGTKTSFSKPYYRVRECTNRQLREAGLWAAATTP